MKFRIQVEPESQTPADTIPAQTSGWLVNNTSWKNHPKTWFHPGDRWRTCCIFWPTREWRWSWGVLAAICFGILRSQSIFKFVSVSCWFKHRIVLNIFFCTHDKWKTFILYLRWSKRLQRWPLRFLHRIQVSHLQMRIRNLVQRLGHNLKGKVFEPKFRKKQSILVLLEMLDPTKWPKSGHSWWVGWHVARPVVSRDFSIICSVLSNTIEIYQRNFRC